MSNSKDSLKNLKPKGDVGLFTHHTGGVRLVTHTTHQHTLYGFAAQNKSGLNAMYVFIAPLAK